MYTSYGLKSITSSSVVLQPGLGLGLPLRVFVMVKYVRCEVISPTINLVLDILIRPPRNLLAKPADSGEAGDTRARNMAAEFCRRASIMLVGFLNMP
jgi:hypothetical protein